MATVYSCSKSSLQGYFPSCWGEGLCCATLGSQETVPVSVHPCTLGTCPILPWWGPWPLWSPPPSPEQFLLRFLNPGMNLVVAEGGGCLVSHSPHSRCFFQISKAPQGHTPHLALPPLHLASPITILAQLVCSLQACPSSELARLPQVTLWQASQGPMALRTCPRDTCRMLRATPRPPEQVVF